MALNHPESNQDTTQHNYAQLLARYERLMEISRQLTSTLDLNALLDRIIMAAIELTDTEAASILLLDPQTNELRFEAATDISSGTRDALVVPKEGSVAGWVVTHGEYVLVPDAPNDPRWFQDVEKSVEMKTRNILAVPMRSHTKVIGALEALNKKDDAPFTEDDINTLTTLAAQAAVAIENARLFQQNDFIAELVHELRTPLAALKASTALLMRPTLPDDKRADIISTMERETDRLSKMTTEFLDLARLESGRARLEIAPFHMRDLVIESLDIVRPQAQERNISMQVEGADTELEADRGKVKQVLLNLLTNAIKYNRENGRIRISLEHIQEQEGAFLRTAVQDSGQGISKENLAHIFERFYRVADIEGYTQGTGLGLVIAKRIIEAHGGTMWINSEPGSGSTFFFTLPLHTQKKARAAMAPRS
ncbi:MAG: GAF domain-containing sensor histidine kinase [Anaerolineae bacterium]|nr:GAF domain-containing sensor histidine kinase [Anaerolineae bacterium]